jgi:hypothetical protein
VLSISYAVVSHESCHRGAIQEDTKYAKQLVFDYNDKNGQRHTLIRVQRTSRKEPTMCRAKQIVRVTPPAPLRVMGERSEQEGWNSF